MTLLERVKQKNLQLTIREIELDIALKKQLNMNQLRSANLLIFIVAPLCVGFLTRYVGRHPLGALLVRTFLPLGYKSYGALF